MVELSKDLLSPDLWEQIDALESKVKQFRETPLDKVVLEKLKETFRASHIYNSSGMEGNRLTLQETSIVLKEGIDISGKHLKDSIEVRNLGTAFENI